MVLATIILIIALYVYGATHKYVRHDGNGVNYIHHIPFYGAMICRSFKKGYKGGYRVSLIPKNGFKQHNFLHV